jgi:hypothetical protein
MPTPPVAPHKAQESRDIGGVSHIPVSLSATAAAGQHAPDFKYNGGAVLRCPQVYAAFWVPTWSDAAHVARAKRLCQFLTDLLASKYMNVLSQYGVGAGAGAAGTFVKSTFVSSVPAQLTGTLIHQTIQDAINVHVLPEPPQSQSNVCLMIFLDETIAVQDTGITMCEPSGDNAFGYHFDFVTSAGNEFYFAVIPALSDACLNATCGSGGCSLQLSQPQEQRITQVASHEFMEMATDPKFTTGWYGPASDENGDICNGQTASITVGPNAWAVQRQYSKADDVATNGGTWSVLDAPSPMPAIPGGPTASPGGMYRVALVQRERPLISRSITADFQNQTRTRNRSCHRVAACGCHPALSRSFWPPRPPRGGRGSRKSRRMRRRKKSFQRRCSASSIARAASTTLFAHRQNSNERPTTTCTSCASWSANSTTRP